MERGGGERKDLLDRCEGQHVNLITGRAQEASIDVAVFGFDTEIGIEPLWFATFERSDKDLQSDEGLKEFPGATLLCLRRPMFN